MTLNFTAIVQPFLRIVDGNLTESGWPFLNLGPKAFLGIFLFQNTVPELRSSAMYTMNVVTSMFYFYCTYQFRQSMYGFLAMFFSLFCLYRAPRFSTEYIDTSSWLMMMAAVSCLPGCEFSLDVFLLVSFGFWLVPRYEEDTVKCIGAMWFTFTLFCLPVIIQRNDLIEECMDGKNVSNLTVTEHVSSVEL